MAPASDPDSAIVSGRQAASAEGLRPVRSRVRAAVIIAVITVALVELAARHPALQALELWTYDLRVSSRHRGLFAGLQSPTHHRNRNIAIVPVDDETLAAIPDPTTFWLGHHADVASALLSAGARVVAFDYLFAVSGDDYVLERLREQVPGGSATDGQALLDAAQEVFDGERRLFESLTSRRVVIVMHANTEGEAITPLPALAIAAGNENVAMANVIVDDDGVVRRSALYTTVSADGADVPVLALAVVVASHLTGEEVGYDDERGSLLLGRSPIVHDADHRTLVSFLGPPGTFPAEHSFSEVLANADDSTWLAERFAGAAVLIGPAYTGTTDLVSIPVRSATEAMHGVEVHAHLLNTIVNQDWTVPVPLAVDTAVRAGVVLLVIWAGVVLSPGRAAVVTAVAVLATIAAGFVLLFRHGWWLGLAAPIAGALFGHALSFAHGYFVLERRRRLVRSVLGRFVSEEVAREILHDPSRLELGGDRADLSVLFCDLNGFTAFSERSGPEDVIEFLNDYFTRMEAVIFQHGATLKQFVGDEIMVLCGAPRPDPDHAARACALALDMEAEVLRWRDERQAAGLPVLDVKFGVHCGGVVAGNVGSPRRSEYAAVGDVVNTAARVMSLSAEAGSPLLVSDEIRRRVGDRFRFRPAGSFAAKGKGEPLVVHALVGTAEPASPSEQHGADRA